MIGGESRYTRAQKLSSPTHKYESDGELTYDVDENSKTTDHISIEYRDTTYLLTTLPLPDPPDVQYMVKDGADVALIAHMALKDPQKWWIVADANPQIRHPLDYKAGDVIYIPV